MAAYGNGVLGVFSLSDLCIIEIDGRLDGKGRKEDTPPFSRGGNN